MSLGAFFRAIRSASNGGRPRKTPWHPARTFEDLNAHRRFFVQHMQRDHWAELIAGEDVESRLMLVSAGPLYHYTTQQIAADGKGPKLPPRRFFAVSAVGPEHLEFQDSWEFATATSTVALLTPTHIYARQHGIMMRWHEASFETGRPVESHDGALQMTLDEAKTFMRYHSDEGLAYLYTETPK